MGIWEVTITATGTNSKTAHSSYRGTSTGGIASEYSKILAEKLANVDEDVRKMEAVQEQLDAIRDLHEELTGEVQADEDLGNANREDNANSSTLTCVEKVKRFLPDGSVMITTYEDGRMTDRLKLKPNMTVVPDYTAPPEPDGSVATELKPTRSLELQMLLMM